MKFIPHITAVLALVAGLYQLHNYIYNQGRQAERALMQVELNNAMQAQQEIYRQQVQAALAAQASDHAAEIQRLAANQQTEVITQEIIRYVDRTIKVPAECTDLANDVVSLLQQTTAVINSAHRSAGTHNQPGAIEVLPTSTANTAGITGSAKSSSDQRSDNSGLLPTPGQFSRRGEAP